MVKLSRSKIELFLECQRCFWLDVKKGIKRPPPMPYTINNAIDWLLKQEFDRYREKGIRHPIMIKNDIDAVPFQSPDMNKWRHNFTGVQFHHEPTDFLVYGAVDDVWVNPNNELIVVDYKATGAKQHQIYDSYKRQMEVYQWLLRQNKHKVSPTGYFVFAKVNKENGFSLPADLSAKDLSAAGASRESGGNGKALSFDLFVEPQVGDDSWIEKEIHNARGVYNSEKLPDAGAECVYCAYRANAGDFS
ncbi:MAG: hypothetical protein A2122_02240 [Candidatus Liptonbacteria bacterium GWB1_49_6]|uniref:PD-(D/E)XK endonuclease-like domain-containing protein n=1 Tax=Candidatus Liptonbacteria bacterium GWB1_49_6 TaxID=1798644 RepID=A0A1G2C501_9BACT|nr:MAG: hypothetical protein A2122_02240 [Candidatus Liptonbacteria bacterium GWB1_49_6]